MQEIHNLTQRLLGLLLVGDILKGCRHLSVRINFGATVPKRHEIAPASHPGLDQPIRMSPDQIKNKARQDPQQKEIQQGRVLLGNDPVESDLATLVRALGLQQTVHQLRILDQAGLIIDLLPLFIRRKINLVILDHDVPDLSLLHFRQERAVIDRHDLPVRQARNDQTIQE